MKEKQTLVAKFDKFLSDTILYPFLFAAHFVLSLYAINFHEIYFAHLQRSLIVILALPIVLYYFNRFFMKKKLAGLLTFFLTVMILTTNVQFNLFTMIYPGEFNVIGVQQRIFFGIAALNLFAGILVLYMADSEILNLNKITKFLNLFALVLLAGVIIQIGINASYEPQEFNQLDLEPEETNSTKPSIYYIITDKYTSSEVLKNQYNFNNTRFHNSLESQNFSVVKNFYTNYDETYASLASSLNLNYLQDMGVNEGTSQKQVYTLLDNYEVQRFLREQGYNYYHIGGGYTRFNKNADKSYFHFYDFFGGTVSLNRFERIIFQKTIFHKRASVKTHTYANSKSYESISNISENAGKKFVFAHIMSPHRPYTLPKAVDEVEFYSKSEASKKERYVQEVKATNILLNRTVQDIIENEEEAVIIIQGDEGPTLEGSNFTEEKDIRRDHSVMFAHYTPNVSDEKFDDNVNPVNLFRVIFNNYFGKDLPLNEGKTFTVDSGESLEFHEENLSVVLNRTKTSKQ